MTTFIYYLRPGENEELRYSLRSVDAMVPDAEVVIVGTPPGWVMNMTYFFGNPATNPYTNSLYNIGVASTASPGDFYTMNDDFMVLKPLPNPLPRWFNGTAIYHVTNHMKDPRSAERKSIMLRTRDVARKMCGTGDDWEPLNYELHVPMKINGRNMKALISEGVNHGLFSLEEPVFWRTLYGNLYQERVPEQRSDVKFRGLVGAPDRLDDLDFLSTEDKSFPKYQPYLHRRFPERSQWEN